MRSNKYWYRFLLWVNTQFTQQQKIRGLAVVVGLASGVAAVILKNLVHITASSLQKLSSLLLHNYLYFIYPTVGILFALLFMKYIIKKPGGHGVPGILHSISQRKGFIERHQMFSSLITSSLTVGFGGSVGLEGPIVGTGAALGSNIGRAFKLNYRQITLLIGCASSGAVASIFNAPIAGIIFSLEILMLDLTMSSMIPLLMASVSAIITSHLIIGSDILYPFVVMESFAVGDLPFYIGLGLYSGIISAYFSGIYLKINRFFDRFTWKKSLLIGGGILGLLIFLFPSLYGEGYKEVNMCLTGNLDYLFTRNLFSSFSGSVTATIVLLFAITMLKVVATSATFGAGGVGGIFAPSLFVGAHGGILFAMLVNISGIANVSVTNFALVGMAGMMSGIMHAPLFAIFLIAEVSGGYALLLPLMITSVASYVMVKYFALNSVYTRQLADQRILITHDKDKATLTLMKIDPLIEKNFTTITSDSTLGELFKQITKSKRNIFPVIDNEIFKGIVFLNDIRHLLLKTELYDIVKVKDLMYMPSPTVSPNETMEEVVQKFRDSSHYNLPVIDNEKYIGFVSRANTFSAYQKLLSDISED
ncbi:MAG: chloride channel protein [Salinivirgaceae bacterium]|nr:chloride channel protein [Salinivirgaceae bacterium]